MFAFAFPRYRSPPHTVVLPDSQTRRSPRLGQLQQPHPKHEPDKYCCPRVYSHFVSIEILPEMAQSEQFEDCTRKMHLIFAPPQQPSSLFKIELHNYTTVQFGRNLQTTRAFTCLLVCSPSPTKPGSEKEPCNPAKLACCDINPTARAPHGEQAHEASPSCFCEMAAIHISLAVTLFIIDATYFVTRLSCSISNSYRKLQSCLFLATRTTPCLVTPFGKYSANAYEFSLQAVSCQSPVIHGSSVFRTDKIACFVSRNTCGTCRPVF